MRPHPRSPTRGTRASTTSQRKREEDLKLFGKVTDDTINEILKVAKKYKRGKECPHCGMPQTNVRFAKPTTFFESESAGEEEEEVEEGGEAIAVEGEEAASRLTANMIREWFERIPDDDLRLVDFEPEVARPEWMVLQVLPVPPVDVRPSIILESGIQG